MACSNPTSKSECTAEQAWDWSEGKVIFSSGSPFDTFQRNGVDINFSQGNNMYQFPGIGMGVVMSGARLVNDRMLYAASCAVADALTEEEVKESRIYPHLNRIIEVSKAVAVAVAKAAVESKMCPPIEMKHKKGIEVECSYSDLYDNQFYTPSYEEIVYDPSAGNHVTEKTVH
jgi:malate dehydrogenase (oxaloacetate-decarboxylating)(NADP+)